MPNTVGRLVSMALVACMSGASTAVAQEQAVTPPTTTLTVKARLVLLDVVVTDKAGQIVPGLSRDDFSVFENGVAQQIKSFEMPAKDTIAANVAIHSSAELAKLAPQAPVDILVLDEFNTRFEDMDFARYALRKYLTAQPEKLPQPTMMIAVSLNKFTVLRDYTQNRQELLTALEKHLALYPWHLQYDPDIVRRLSVSLSALEQVAEAEAGHPGHKNIIWVGRGFPGINLQTTTAEIKTGITGAIQTAVNMLRDSRITLYTIDPTALSSSVQVTTTGGDPDDPSSVNEDDPLAGDVSFTSLAPATGGKAYFSRNDVDREIGTSIRDGANFYTLGYTPTSPDDTEQAYRHIRIKLNRPGLSATTRDGYYAAPASAQPADANRVTFDLRTASTSTLAYTALPVKVAASGDPPGSFVVQVDSSALSWTATQTGDEEAHLVVLTASFDAKGKMLSRVTDEMTAHVQAAMEEKTRSGSTSFRISLQLPPGAASLRFVVRNPGDGKIGTADLLLTPGAEKPIR
jgi:VWFA-related protein